MVTLQYETLTKTPPSVFFYSALFWLLLVFCTSVHFFFYIFSMSVKNGLLILIGIFMQ